MELGLNKPKAKVLLKRIIEWKENGLPADFHITEPSASTAVDPVKTNIQHHGFAPDTAQNINADVVITEKDDNYVEEKQLDDDFVAARWCWCRAAAARIVAAAEAGSHLAEAI